MTKLTKAALLIAVSVISACTNPDRFGGGAGNTVDLNNQAGINQSQLGSPSDPTSVAYFNQTIGDRVLFVVDQSTLTDQAKALLDQQASWLLTNSDFKATIEGHADEQGTREYNLALGNRRAAAVRDYLISRGVPASRLSTNSFGKERPVATCANESCYSLNRRAVTVIAYGVGGLS